MQGPQKTRNDKAGPKVAEALKKRHFDAYYVEDGKAAVELALSLIPEGSSVSWGGSATMDEIGIKDALEAANYTIIDRDKAANPAERKQMMKQALLCDTFIMSANAVSEDGQLVNIDGNGNRVAALCFGPESVIVIAGMNKVCKDLEAAMARARGIAAPVNAQRFADKGIFSPCQTTGMCADCMSPDSICSQFVVTRMDRNKGRIKVILVGEDLGF